MATDDLLWLDSSIIRMGIPKLRALTQLAREKSVRVVVHPHIHLEICRYLRQNSSRPFSQQYIDQSLEQLGIAVEDFNLTMKSAETYAEMLHTRYPTSDAWKKAKLSSVRARLPQEVTVKESEVPMTTDWWVALEVEVRQGYIAVEDKGDEWSALRLMKPCRAFSFSKCMQWLQDRNPTT